LQIFSTLRDFVTPRVDLRQGRSGTQRQKS